MSELSKYDLEYQGVKCTGVDWEHRIFCFIKNEEEYRYQQQTYYSCTADTDHIRWIIENEFLPFWNSQHIDDILEENKLLREQLANSLQIKAQLNETLYMPWYWNGVSGIMKIKVLKIEYIDNMLYYHTKLIGGNDFMKEYQDGVFIDSDFNTVIFKDMTGAKNKVSEWAQSGYNIYLCGDSKYVSDTSFYVIAKTRGKAKQIYHNLTTVPFLNVRCSIIKRNVQKTFSFILPADYNSLHKYGLTIDYTNSKRR